MCHNLVPRPIFLFLGTRLACANLVIWSRMYECVTWIPYVLATRRRIKVNRDARRELTKMLEKWKDKITKDMANMERKHTNEKLHMWKNLKPGVQDTIRPENYAITPKYMNRPFVTS